MELSSKADTILKLKKYNTNFLIPKLMCLKPMNGKFRKIEF